MKIVLTLTWAFLEMRFSIYVTFTKKYKILKTRWNCRNLVTYWLDIEWDDSFNIIRGIVAHNLCIQLGASHDVWNIQQNVVDRSETSLPMVEFSTGDSGPRTEDLQTTG